jgi:hypothetical protein
MRKKKLRCSKKEMQSLPGKGSFRGRGLVRALEKEKRRELKAQQVSEMHTYSC